MEFSIYIHFPYCKSKCNYCDFYSITNLNSSGRLVSALLREIENHVTDPRVEGGRVAAIFFGGGTPSLIPPEQILQIIKSIEGLLPVLPDAEITLEANPDDLDDTAIKKYLEVGINRISLGAQSFDDRDLRVLGRRHDSQAIIRSAEGFKSSGLTNFSLDLIYGIPGQSFDSWRETVGLALSLDPKHISAYCLTVEEDTPLYCAVREERIMLPSDSELGDMYIAAVDMLESAGLLQYELSNFARVGFESRHNLAYWTSKPYLGFGPSASSYVHPHRWTNVADVTRYIDMIDDCNHAVGQEEELTSDMIRSEFVMLSLRLKAGLDLGEYRNRFGEDLSETHANRIQHFVKEGMMERRDDCLRLTPKGMFVSDAIIADLV
ncbi:MAG: radical SAM family heme chaperone HemW [Candidatus Zixiibacteriota bacterium]